MDKYYDYIIIGAGPCGISLLNKLTNEYYKNVLCIEKTDTFSNLKQFMNKMLWHSHYGVSKLHESHFQEKDPEKQPYIEELIIYYEKFIDDNNIRNNIVIDTFLNCENIDYKIKVICKNTNFYCNKLINCTGTLSSIEYPRPLNFKIINSDVVRYMKQWEDIKNKTILLIGGGFSSLDLSVKLNTNNNIIILSRKNKYKIQKLMNDQINKWGQKNINHNNINIYQYRNINQIKDNIIYYDNNNQINFDKCVILIGYVNNFKLQQKNTYNFLTPVLENIIGGNKKTEAVGEINNFINNKLIPFQEYIGNNEWEKTIPYRSPSSPLHNFKEFFENKYIVDLGCGSGYLIKYIEEILNAKKVLGIDIKSMISHKVYNLNVIHNNYTNLNFNEKIFDNVDTFYIWNEYPEQEISTIEKIKKYHTKCNFIIAYNTKSFYCPRGGCGICYYLNGIQNKINILKKYFNNKKINYKEVDYKYNEGNGEYCRQQGIFKYFIISF